MASPEAAAPAEPAAAAPAADAEGFSPRLSGSVIERFRVRVSHQENDQDSFSTLLLRLQLSRRVELLFKGDLFVDAGRDASPKNRLADIWDTWDGSAQGRLQELYLHVSDLAGLDLRLGRVVQFGARTIQLDGATAAWSSELLTLRAFGGLPVWFYKSPWRGDVVGGGGLDLTPWSSTKLSLDYLHVTENLQHSSHYRHDDLVVASLRQQLGSWAVARLRAEMLADELRAAEGGATFTFADLGLTVRGRCEVLFQPQVRLTNELDPYSAIIGAEEPHLLAEGGLTQQLFDSLAVELDYAYRRVTGSSNRGPWNRDYHRWGAAVHIYDIPFDGLTLTVRGQQWDVKGVDGHRGNDVQELGGELSYRVAEFLTIGGGSSYELYRYDVFSGSVRQDVRLYFVRAEVRAGGHRFDAAWEFEHDDLDDFHVVRLGWRYDF